MEARGRLEVSPQSLAGTASNVILRLVAANLSRVDRLSGFVARCWCQYTLRHPSLLRASSGSQRYQAMGGESGSLGRNPSGFLVRPSQGRSFALEVLGQPERNAFKTQGEGDAASHSEMNSAEVYTGNLSFRKD